MRIADTRPRREHTYDGENLVVYMLVFLRTYGPINTIVSLLRKQWHPSSLTEKTHAAVPQALPPQGNAIQVTEVSFTDSE